MAIGSAPEIGKEFITGGKIYYPWIEGDVQHQLMWGDSKVVYICGRPENVYSAFEWECHKGCCGNAQGEPLTDTQELPLIIKGEDGKEYVLRKDS